jgi:putative ABC transport system ATP-binding protein
VLHCLAGNLRPDSGEVRILGDSLSGLSEQRRSALRLSKKAYVLQSAELIPELTLLENVALPLQLLGTRHRLAFDVARESLSAVGLEDRGDQQTGAVSGGEAQRAAIARALVHAPQIVFADEPTGALDTVTGERVLNLLLATASERGASVLLVTHDHRVAAHADRVLIMRDGVVSGPVAP